MKWKLPDQFMKILCCALGLALFTGLCAPHSFAAKNYDFTHANADVRLSGTVTSLEDGSALPGVSIIVKGTSKGTISDINGKYELSVEENATLVFSFIGFATKETVIKSQTQLDMALVPDQQSLKEVVVTAMGYQREKESLPYSVGIVNSENLTFAKSNDLSTSLAGKISGVQLQGSPSSTFDNGNIVIRGGSKLGTSTSTDNNPIYVVDGTVTEQNSVIMDNVKSITVLKGAAASALYGQRAQNGVIIITTKKGTKGAPTVELNLSAAFEKVSMLFPFQDQYGGGYASTTDSPGTSYDSEGFPTFKYKSTVHPASWASFNGQRMLDYGADESWGPKMNGQLYRPYYSWFPGSEFGQLSPLTPQPNSVKNFYNTGVNLNNSIAFSGGGDNFTYRMTYANQDRTLIVPEARRNQHQIGLSSSLDINKKLSVSSDISFTYSKTKGQPGEGYALNGSNVTQNFTQWWQRQLDTDRLKDYQNEDGSYMSWNIGDPNSTSDPKLYLKPQYWDSPYYTVQKNYSQNNTNRLVGNVGLKYKLLEDLTWQSYARMSYTNIEADSRFAFGGFNANSYSINQSIRREMNYETNLNYHHAFGDYSVDAMVGGNIRQNNWNELKETTQGGLTFPDFFDISASISRPNVVRDYALQKVRSVYGRVSLGYKSLLFLDGTLRNDWSSSLPSQNNSYMYPSLGGSFVFSELLKNSPVTQVLSSGKIKASWAKVGSDLPPFQVNTSLINQPLYGSNASAEIGNEYRTGNVKPSLTTSWEAGFDVRLFNKIGLEFTYYQDDNKDQILSLDVDPTTGFSKYQINAGKIQRKGVEASLNFTPFKSDFYWDVTMSFGRNRSKVVELADGLNTYLVGTERANTRLEHRVGSEWGMLVGQKWRRNAEGRVLIDSNGSPLVDQNQDGGSIAPKFTGGLFNTLGYKSFSLSFSFDFQKGGQFASRAAVHGVGAGQHAMTVGVNDKGNDWRTFPSLGGGIRVDGVYGPGILINGEDVSGRENTTYIAASRYFNGARQGDNLNQNVLDASYIKLREIRLGYELPKTFLSKVGIKGANLGIMMNNAWLIYAPAAKEFGIDPSELEQYWYEGGQLPQTRTSGVNLRIRF